MSALSSLSTWLVDLLAPRQCPGCRADTRAPPCGECRRQLSPAPRRSVASVPVVGGALYAPPVDAMIAGFKYGDRSDFAGALASLIPEPPERSRDTWLVPVPLHPKRLRERRYDQAALLGRALARRWQLPLVPRALVRARATNQQASLDAHARSANVAGAFRAARPNQLSGREVVLVDDVLTTGATAQACIECLVRSGARVLAVACVAVTERSHAG